MFHYRQFEIHVLLKAKALLVTDCEYTGHIYLAKWTFCNIESSTLTMNMIFPISFVIFLFLILSVSVNLFHILYLSL